MFSLPKLAMFSLPKLAMFVLVNKSVSEDDDLVAMFLYQ